MEPDSIISEPEDEEEIDEQVILVLQDGFYGLLDKAAKIRDEVLATEKKLEDLKSDADYATYRVYAVAEFLDKQVGDKDNEYMFLHDKLVKEHPLSNRK